MIIFAEYLIPLIDFYTASLLCRQHKALMWIATVFFSSCNITIALFQFVCFNLTVIAIFPKNFFVKMKERRFVAKTFLFVQKVFVILSFHYRVLHSSRHLSCNVFIFLKNMSLYLDANKTQNDTSNNLKN